MASVFRAALKLFLLLVGPIVWILAVCYQLMQQEIKYTDLLEVEAVEEGEGPDCRSTFVFKVQGREIRRGTVPLNAPADFVWNKRALSVLPGFETFTESGEGDFKRVHRIGLFTVEHGFCTNGAYFTESIHAGVLGWTLYCWYGATGNAPCYVLYDPPYVGDEPGAPAER